MELASTEIVVPPDTLKVVWTPSQENETLKGEEVTLPPVHVAKEASIILQEAHACKDKNATVNDSNSIPLNYFFIPKASRP